MTLSVHDKLQKLQANIAALELKQQKLKDNITRRMMIILEQEKAFTIDPPLLLGAIADAIRKLKTLDDLADEKTRLRKIGEDFFKRRLRLPLTKAKTS